MAAAGRPTMLPTWVGDRSPDGLHKLHPIALFMQRQWGTGIDIPDTAPICIQCDSENYIPYCNQFIPTAVGKSVVQVMLQS